MNQPSRYKLYLNSLQQESMFRIIPKHIHSRNIDLLSNDYLGLNQSEHKLKNKFFADYPDAELTSSASRLLSRKQKYLHLLETKLSELYERPALIFNSGYHANTGVLSALSLPDTLIVSDKLIHASSIDGIRLSKADNLRFRHNDLNSLRTILEKNKDKYKDIFVAVESIYSMDGDLVPLKDLIALKTEFPIMKIVLDEAHAFGVRGHRGLGLAEELELIKDIDIIIGTLGKGAASYGAFAIASEEMINFFTNTARSFIFSTSIPPICCAWSLYMIDIIITLNDKREHLKSLSKYFINRLEEITGYSSISSSQIVPLIIGNSENALKFAEIIRNGGYDAMAIRRPTVPSNSERIRFSLNATLNFCQLDPLLEIIERNLNLISL